AFSSQLSAKLRIFFFSSRRRHTRWPRDWSSDVCSSDLTRSFTGSSRAAVPINSVESLKPSASRARVRSPPVGGQPGSIPLCTTEIGRASCRERVIIIANILKREKSSKLEEKLRNSHLFL